MPTETSPAGEVSFSFYPPTPEAIATLAGKLRNGEVVAIPTETVYGLAAHALDPQACSDIFTIKGRPLLDPLIVHIHDLDQVRALAYPDARALRLAEHFWPGPLTMVLPKRAEVPDIVTAGLDTVAVRMPAHPVTRALLAAAAIPLAAPSANPFGYISPTTAEHVASNLGHRIRCILDGGPCAIGLESTIVDLSRPESVRILRPGQITAEAIAGALGLPAAQVETVTSGSTPAVSAMPAPGMLERHYSPRTPLRLFAPASLPSVRPDEAVVFLRRPDTRTASPGSTFWFSEDGNLETVARNLYDLLRRLDGQAFALLHVESPAREGLGTAIADRLQRAASRPD